MAVHHRELRLSTSGDGEMHDLTAAVAEALHETGITDGIVTVFAPGATASITTIEFEPGLRHDFPAAFERFAPKGIGYLHDETWHDGNGHSHVRASTVGPSLTVPAAAGKLMLGKWQQIVLVDWDNRPRDRRLIVTILGE